MRTRYNGVEAGGGASLTSDNPAALGSVSAGAASTAARADHVHPTTGIVPTTRTVAGAALSGNISAATLAAALAAELVAASIEAPFSLTTWTDTEADGAVIAVAAGAAVAVVPDGVASCVAYSTRPWSAGDGSFDLRARLTITGTAEADCITYLVAAFGAQWLFFRCRGDGMVEAKHNFGGDTVLGFIASRPIDGTTHVRIRRSGARITMSYGTSADALTDPAENGWTVLYDDFVAALATRTPTGLRVQAATEGGDLAAETTVTWSDCELRSGQV